MKKVLMAAALAVGLAGTSVEAATSYTVDSGWANFSWSGGVGTFSDQGGFDITLASDSTLTLVDTFAYGDMFEVWLDGISQGTTSSVADYDPMNFSSPDTALTMGFSNGTFVISAGTYLLDFSLFQDARDASGEPYSNGGAYFRIDTGVQGGVPEPATWLMMIMGFGVAGMAMRRRMAAAAV